jgi:hypothetical protein
MDVDQGLKSINLYDIYANIVPGIVFLFGIVLPLDFVAILRELFGPDAQFTAGIAQLLLFIVISFVVGQILQAFGSRFDGDHGFGSLVSDIRDESEQDRHEVTEFDDVFWELCKDEFVLSENFESSDRLFKAVLAYLEHSSRTRALRMQALYLFARGMYVASLSLCLIYITILVSLFYGYLPEDVTPFFRPSWVIISGIVVTGLLTYISEETREGLESDWIKYTMTEFYLEMVEQ